MRKLICACLAVILTACTSGSTTTGSNEPANVEGTWQGQMQVINVGGTATSHTVDATVVLSQVTTSTGTGTQIEFTSTVTGTGSIPSTGQGCFTGGTIEGTVTGNKFQMTITDPNGATISITATVDGAIISGKFSSSGGPCDPSSGNFTVTLVSR